MGQMFSCDECTGGGTSSADEVDDRSLKWSRAVDFQVGSPEKKRDELTRELLLMSLYRVVDKNADGFLQLSELSKMMTNADVFMKVADTNSDGKMSQNEFMEWSRLNIVTYLSSKRGSGRFLVQQLNSRPIYSQTRMLTE
jgi:hypothetical protein